MPVLAVPKSAGLQTAFGANKPLVLAANHVIDAITRKWTTNGTDGGLDVTALLMPATRACDGKLYDATRPSDQATNVYFFNLRFPSPGVSIDAVFLEMLQLLADYDCTFEVADDGDFLVNPLEIFDFGTLTGTHRRACGLASNVLYTGVEYARFRFENLDNDDVPSIGETVVSQILQLSRHFNIGHDEAALGAEVTEFRGKNRAVTRYVDAKGFSDFHARATPTGDDNYGLDDVTTFRSMHRDADYGTRTLVFVRRPNTAPNTAHFGMIDPNSVLTTAGPYKRIKEFSFEEHPPFVDREA